MYICMYVYVHVCACVSARARSCIYKDEIYLIDLMIPNGLCGF